MVTANQPLPQITRYISRRRGRMKFVRGDSSIESNGKFVLFIAASQWCWLHWRPHARRQCATGASRAITTRFLAGLCYHGVTASPCVFTKHCFASFGLMQVVSRLSASRSLLYTPVFRSSSTRPALWVVDWGTFRPEEPPAGSSIRVRYLRLRRDHVVQVNITCIVHADCFPKSELSTSIFWRLKDTRNYSFFFVITIAPRWESNGHVCSWPPTSSRYCVRQ